MGEWRKEQYPDLVNFVLGALLIISPWASNYMSESGASANAVLSGTLVVLLATTALAAFAKWQEWWNLAAGCWVVVSPWLVAFSANALATRVHVIIGSVVTLMAGVRIWLERGQHAI